MARTRDIMTAKGKELAEMLGLKRKANGRYNTTRGDKTDLGLYLSVERFIQEAQEEISQETQ